MVVMGVAGCGKSTIAEGLAAALGGVYLDGDSFHPPENIAKMSAGTPLTDEDRWPWLARFAQEISGRDASAVVGACSALKRSYRDHIRDVAGESILFLYLDGSRELIASRMSERTGHFMPTSLLDSQFAALEVPAEDECARAIGIEGSAAEIISDIVEQLLENGKDANG